MSFVFKLIIAFGKFAITVIVVALILYLSVLIINRVVQFVAEQMGYEVGDFFSWIGSKFKALRKNKEVNNERRKEGF